MAYGHHAFGPHRRVRAPGRRVRADRGDADQGEAERYRRRTPGERRAARWRRQVARRWERRLDPIELAAQAALESGVERVALNLRHRTHVCLKETPEALQVGRTVRRSEERRVGKECR